MRLEVAVASLIDKETGKAMDGFEDLMGPMTVGC
jgi:hypothetical protein